MIAAAALFLAFAALQYDYRLLNEVTKFSARHRWWSLEFAQGTQNARQNGNTGSELQQTLLAAAQPRTDGINYVTRGLQQLGRLGRRR